LEEQENGLNWGRLVRGTLIRRYKRFLADVRLDDGSEVTAHCPNTGSMRGCSESGRPVWLSLHDDPRRRYPYTWEIIEMPGSLVGVNTGVPNRLVKAALLTGAIEPLAGYESVRSEVKSSQGTRLDLLLEAPHRPACYVEVKNCTLVEGGLACFPDAVTRRGRKHLDELADIVGRGERGVSFYLVQRMDAERFRPADHMDPEYGRALRRAVGLGVEALVYDVRMDLNRIELNDRLPVEL